MDIKDIEKYGVDPSVIKQYIEKAKNGDKIVAVAGEFSSGKSTFINAFLDKKGFIPSARIECTPVLLEFVNSDNDKIEISYKDGSYTEVDNTHENIMKYAVNTETYDKNIVSLSIPVQSSYLTENTHLIDTPGSNTVHKEHGEITNMILKKADIVLYVIKVSLSEVDIKNIKEIMKYSSQILFIVSHMDEKSGDGYINSSEERINKCVSAVREELINKVGIKNPDVLPIGSLAYYYDDSLMKEVRECIKFGIETNSREVVKNRIKKQLKYILENKYEEMNEKYKMISAFSSENIDKLETKQKLMNEKIKRISESNSNDIKSLDEKINYEMKKAQEKLEKLFDMSADELIDKIRTRKEVDEKFINETLEDIKNNISVKYKGIVEDSINKVIETVYQEKNEELRNTVDDLNLDFDINMHSPDLQEIDTSEIDDKLFELREEQRQLEAERQKAESEVSITIEESGMMRDKLDSLQSKEEEILQRKIENTYVPEYKEVIEEGYGGAGKRMGRFVGECIDVALMFVNPGKSATTALKVADKVKDGTKAITYIEKGVKVANKAAKTAKKAGGLGKVVDVLDWLSIGKYGEIIGEKIGSAIKPEQRILVEDEEIRAAWEAERNEIDYNIKSVRMSKADIQNQIADGEISIMQAKRKMSEYDAEITMLEKKQKDVAERLRKQAELDSREKVIDYYRDIINDSFNNQKEDAVNTLKSVMDSSYNSVVEKCNNDFNKKLSSINENMESIINEKDNILAGINVSKNNIEEFKNYEKWVDEWIQ